MHHNRIYRGQLPDTVTYWLAKECLADGDLSRHIWDGATCGDPGWVYLDHLAINHLTKEMNGTMHVSLFLNIDPEFNPDNLWLALNPMEVASL